MGVVMLIAQVFLFGKLFPYSPLIAGFEKNELENLIIYSQKGSECQGIAGADTLIAGLERFHDLEFISNPELFLFRDSISYIKHSPSKARFCTFPNSSNQMGTTSYPHKTETYSLIARGNFMPPTDYKTKKEDNIKLEVPDRINFIYSEFACIVDYMIENYGKEKFLDYIKALIEEHDHDRVFKQVYGFEFEILLSDFRKLINEGESLFKYNFQV